MSKIDENALYLNEEEIYSSASYSFRLVEDAGILTDCSIKTQEPEDLLDFDFSGADVENKIIMKVRHEILSFVSLEN